MKQFDQPTKSAPDHTIVIALPYAIRQRSRTSVQRSDGSVWGLIVPRGQTLHAGLLLASNDGAVVHIQAASETLTAVVVEDLTRFAQVCYHLGNRHTQVEISHGQLWFPPDHVLEQMCHSWGGLISQVERPFEPELGAYAVPYQGHHHG